MSVREQRCNVHILVELNRSIDLFVTFAGLEHERRIDKGTVAYFALWRLLGEDETDARNVAGRSPVGGVMNLERENRAGLDLKSRARLECHCVSTGGGSCDQNAASASQGCIGVDRLLSLFGRRWFGHNAGEGG